ncbi:hypothetical protein Tco_0365661 [Tanacetum coccineum]
MDPMISLGQKNTLAEYMILFGADNRPPMLDKDLYSADIYSLSEYHRVLKIIWEGSINKWKIQNSATQEVRRGPIPTMVSDVLSTEAQQDSMILSVIEQMSEQMINHVNNWEKANKEQNNESITAELERYKEKG